MMKLGLSTAGRQIIRGGKPYRGIGINFYDALLHSADDLEARFAVLASKGIPFARVNAGDFAAGSAAGTGWRLYFDNPTAWWARIDQLVTIAEKYGVGLILSMFWRYATTPDLMAYAPGGTGLRDALDQWGVASSATRTFMRAYTAAFVTRYAQRPGVWAWQMGNEFNTYAANYPRASFPGRGDGSPAAYATAVDATTAIGATDQETYAAMFAAMQDWCAVVAANDPHGRIRISGNSVPQVSIYNQSNGISAAIDTYDQWMSGAPGGRPFPEYENPRCMDVVSAHIYQGARQDYWYWNDKTYAVAKPEGLIRTCKAVAEFYGRPFVLDEWGACAAAEPAVTADATAELAQFTSMLATIVKERVPLSALWNFGYAGSNAVTGWNVDVGGAREYQLNALAAANQAIAL